jgi:hypothetical protein
VDFIVRVDDLKENTPRASLGKDDQGVKLTVKEAGRLGGLTTLARYGLAHYREAGRKGQAKLAARCGQAQRCLWGAMGGRPRRIKLANMGEKGHSR